MDNVRITGGRNQMILMITLTFLGCVACVVLFFMCMHLHSDPAPSCRAGGAVQSGPQEQSASSMPASQGLQLQSLRQVTIDEMSDRAPPFHHTTKVENRAVEVGVWTPSKTCVMGGTRGAMDRRFAAFLLWLISLLSMYAQRALSMPMAIPAKHVAECLRHWCLPASLERVIENTAEFGFCMGSRNVSKRPDAPDERSNPAHPVRYAWGGHRCFLA